MEIKIANKKIGKNNPVFIVAELSANHVHNFDTAVASIKAIKKSGADAVKIQTYTPDTMTIDSNNKFFQIKHTGLWDGKSLYKLYKEAYMPWEWQPKLKKVTESLGLIFFSTPFDKTAVDFLEKLNVPAYKIASFEITDIPLIEYIASKGKPVIISTGVAKLLDIRLSLQVCKKAGNKALVLLKCTSAYPAPFNEINLKTIPDMKKRFGTLVGLSDHTRGISVPIAAVAIGASIIEKHFILDRKLGGPDEAFSLEPQEFKSMVTSIREVEKALGEVTYTLSKTVKKNKIFFRSLFAVQDIKKGQRFTEKNIRSIRPGYGLPPKYLNKIIGRKAQKDIPRGTPLSWKLISPKYD